METRRHPVLLVDDEEYILESLKLLLQGSGFEDIETISDARKVLPFLAEQPISAIVLDLGLPFINGTELLASIRNGFPHIPVIILTAANDVSAAVNCMRSGAFDYLVKPVERNRLVLSIGKAIEISSLRNEVSTLKHYLLGGELRNRNAFDRIITQSRAMHQIFLYMEAVAQSFQPVLITGETGTGKELFAQAMHNLSGRAGDFVAVNVAGLDDTMFSDTLFGHEKGAFTGAERRRDGMIARAENGTLFLDEIGDLPESAQVKLMRLLEEREYYPLGSDMPRRSGSRIVAATNRDLPALMGAGKFRNDLYYRLCAHQIRIPPLRKRTEDIPLLTDHYVQEAAISMSKNRPPVTEQVYRLLAGYDFPGNVRELRAMLYDAVARHDGTSGGISLDAFGHVRELHMEPDDGKENSYMLCFPSFPTLREAENHLVGDAVKISKGNISAASSLLGITRQALHKRLKQKHQ
ncbi:MAG: sigma-54-dependent Fis family transcriptional regulator [Nitrospirae bacterium]|nr:sigma-54-dependent Fis family transcriptional regulator [Nitrospirota bacterium]